MESQEIKSFSINKFDLWYDQLTSKGAVVVKNVLSQEEVKEATNLFWEWLEDLGSGIKRKDPKTWEDKYWPGKPGLGFFCTYGGCHSKASWYLRCNKKVQKCFKDIWATQSLITSFDTFIAWRPWWVNEDWLPSVQNLHVDQNPFFKNGFKCVQGMIPLRDVRKNQTGGLMVVPNTNNNVTQLKLCERYPYTRFNRSDWLQLQNDDPFMDKGILIECNAGDMILWDSRTIHGGLICNPSTQFKQKNCTQLARLSMTVSMVPREWASKQVLERRKIAFEKMYSNTHWPHQYNIAFLGGVSQHIDAQKLKQKRVQMTEEIKTLI